MQCRRCQHENLHVLRRAQTTLVPLAVLSYHSPGNVAIGSA